MITYLPLSSIPLPDKVNALMVSLNLQNYIAIPQINGFFVKDLERFPPSFAQKYGFNTASFLFNAFTMLVTVLFNVGCFGSVWLLAKCKQPLIHRYGEKWLSGYRWRNFGVQWVLSYLDFSIFAYLCAQQLTFGSPISIIDSVLACIIAAFNCILPFAMLYFTLRYKALIISRDFEPISSWKFLYEGQKNSKGCISCLYHPLFVLRRLIYALTLVFLSDFPLIQSVIFMIHSILTVLFLLIYMPFIDKLEAFTVTISEIAICITLSLSTGYNFDLSASFHEFITVGISVGVYVAIGLPLISACIGLILKAGALLKGRNQRKCAVIGAGEGGSVLPERGAANSKEKTEGIEKN